LWDISAIELAIGCLVVKLRATYPLANFHKLKF
jgi:hypothetical protein